VRVRERDERGERITAGFLILCARISPHRLSFVFLPSFLPSALGALWIVIISCLTIALSFFLSVFIDLGSRQRHSLFVDQNLHV
jgi:hypothetical protein